jgi:NADP-dependent 3-hydroxy acid dehydrogenase YdfG
MKDLNSYWKVCLLGKRILITGGSTGIGRETAILLSQLGVKCLICGRNQEQIDETIFQIRQLSVASYCIGIVADVASEEGVEQLFAAMDNEFGGIDILINNASIAHGSILEGTYADWEYVVNTNLLGYMACVHHAAKRMQETGYGHIVNIGSMSAEVRDDGSSVYVGTKSAVQGFSEAIRKELNPKGIKVTLIEPGAVDTDMQKGERSEKLEKIEEEEMLKAEDIAITIAFCLAQPHRSEIISLQIRPHLQVI